MALKICVKCSREIKSDFEKCRYCGADQRSWYSRNKGGLKFLIGLTLVILILSVFVGPKLRNRNSSDGRSGRKAGIISIDQEVRTDEYILKVISVNIVKPRDEQVKLFQINNDELLIEVEWQYEPIQNKKLTSSPFVSLSYYPSDKPEIEKKTSKIMFDEVTTTTSKAVDEELVRIINTFKIKEEIIETEQWQLTIEADWSIGVRQSKE